MSIFLYCVSTYCCRCIYFNNFSHFHIYTKVQVIYCLHHSIWVFFIWLLTFTSAGFPDGTVSRISVQWNWSWGTRLLLVCVQPACCRSTIMYGSCPIPRWMRRLQDHTGAEQESSRRAFSGLLLSPWTAALLSGIYTGLATMSLRESLDVVPEWVPKEQTTSRTMVELGWFRSQDCFRFILRN